jgi:leucyl-tRNA synthetase
LTLAWRAVEEKWQRRWDNARIFEGDPDPAVAKFMITIAYPYANMPFHVGHGRPYTLTDAYARFKRMRGLNVLFPMAFHYTGTPILAIAKRVAANDQSLLDDLTKVYEVPSDTINEFSEPLNIAEYFRRELKESMVELGYSIDWRREFTTIDPQYSRFIEWQFRRLRAEGLITRGSHPVGWCPSCGNPMGQHDTKGDIEPDIGEVTLVKFRLGDRYLPTGTLRPETVFGVTNIWVRPDTNYVAAEVDGEVWVVSRECTDKLKLMGRKVAFIETVAGSSLVGVTVENPVTEDAVPIFPAHFVDPRNATGTVMSVPGHAPYDFIALMDLKKRAHELSLDIQRSLATVRPISLIALDGYSEYPAQDALRHVGATDQLDENVEEATREVYKQEFRRGTLKPIAGRYAGMKVPEARDAVREAMRAEGTAEAMYELLNGPIFCRCGSEVVVKVLEDQWFIDYGIPEWKQKAHECLDAMRVVPGELRTEFDHVIDWLKAKACARKHGMGTRLPWDPEWIIESLSDSVIYMSYYTIVRHIHSEHLEAEHLTDAVFDYVFLGAGDPTQVAKDTGIQRATLQAMRGEFTYFYPLDSRNSGRDLIPNHLTFFIFNHTALFPRPLWPRQIVVTGSVLMEGKKMSKSLGNIIPLKTAVREYGADPFRLTILSTAELVQDADFSVELAKAVRDRLEHFYAFALEVIATAPVEETERRTRYAAIDRWMLSRLQQHIATITTAMEKVRLREATHTALYILDQDTQWYLRRTRHTTVDKRGVTAAILKRVLEVRVKLLAPFTPHLSEELWEQMGNPGLISVAPWPSHDASQVDERVVIEEGLVKSLMNDIFSILQATKITPKKVHVYTASAWKWDVYRTALGLARDRTVTVSALMEKAMATPELRHRARRVAPFARKLVDELMKTPPEVVTARSCLGYVDEERVLNAAKGFYTAEFHASFDIHREDHPEIRDPKGRAPLAEPYRPAVYIE